MSINPTAARYPGYNVSYLRDLKDENTALKGRSESLQVVIDARDDEIKRGRATTAKLLGDVRDLQAKNNKLEHAVSDYTNAAKHKNDVIRTFTHELQATVSRLEQRNAEQAKAYGELNAKYQQLNAKYQQRKAAYFGLLYGNQYYVSVDPEHVTATEVRRRQQNYKVAGNHHALRLDWAVLQAHDEIREKVEINKRLRQRNSELSSRIDDLNVANKSLRDANANQYTKLSSIRNVIDGK